MSDNSFDDFEINDINIAFVERILKALPSNIYYKDSEGKYVFCTHYWNHLKTPDDDPNWTIRGKYDVDIRKDKENALKAMEEDKKIFETKKGTSYEIRIDVDGKTDYLELIKEPVFDDSGNVIGISGLINNITDKKLIEQKLEMLATTDMLTETKNRAYLDIWISKNRNKDIYPLSVIMADCNGLKIINDKYGHLIGDKYIIEAARIMKECLLADGTVIRMGGDEFMVIIPNCDKANAEKYIKRVLDVSNSVTVLGLPVSISLGASTTSDVSLRIEDLIKEADKEMYASKEEWHRLHPESNR